MKVTYNEILGAHRAAQALTQSVPGAPELPFVPPLVALQLARAARVLAQEAQAFDAGRIVLVKQYASEPDEHGKQFVPPEHVAEFNEQLAKLAKQEIDLDIQAIKLADFGEVQLPMTSLYGMEWLIEG